jgi:hemerythrin-like domain-containing protein
MRNIVQELGTEHTGMERLLRILEKQIEVFESDGQPDYKITEHIILFFLDFPDQCHHPKEDLVAEELLELRPERAERLRGLFHQHKELAALTRRMASTIRRVLDEDELPREDVIRAAKEFVSPQRHHIEMEEVHFLPLADELLSDAHLNELDSDIFRRKTNFLVPKRNSILKCCEMTF